MKRLKQVIEQVKEYEDNNCFELKTSVVLHWLKEIENEALAISRVVGQSEQFYCFDEKNRRIDCCKKQCDTCKEMKLMQ